MKDIQCKKLLKMEILWNVDEGKDGKCTCGSKDETVHGGKEGKDENGYDSA